MRVLFWTFLVLLGWAPSLWAGAPDFYCSDYYGRKVTWVADPNQRTVAQADYLASGAPVIYYNLDAAAASGLSEDALNFLYLHECAHLVLGHLVRPATNVPDYNEFVDQADCWAANRYFYQDQKDKVLAIQEELNSLDRGKWAYIAGPVRVLDFENSCWFREPVWTH